MDIAEATDRYETWLGTFTPLIADDLAAKHDTMADAPFPFLRGTYYRWAQRWPEVCPDQQSAPVVWAVGDLHVENFGTWRDAEGRLVWGINDFDEAYPLPYTNDLTRLATSALLAIEGDRLGVDPKDACAALVDGYRQAIAEGSRPIVIAEEYRWFLDLIARKSKASDPGHFWKKLRALESVKGHVPDAACAALKSKLPAGARNVRVIARQAGVGSLGKPRYVALADWLGGPLAREVKALTPSACAWARVPLRVPPSDTAAPSGTSAAPAAASPADTAAALQSFIPKVRQAMAEQGLRCPDPFFETFQHEGRGWVVRRLAADSLKIELKAAPESTDEVQLLQAMGRETANVHLATPTATRALLADLDARKGRWLYAAAQAMVEATNDDQADWKKTRRGSGAARRG